MAKKQLFISHITQETELAQLLKSRLTADFLGMLDTFVSSDRQTLSAGSKWLDELDEALKQADLQIVLCSKESVGRPWVNFEAGGAWLRGIPVIPVCHSGLEPTGLPLPLSMLQSIECGRADGMAKLYDAIARSLDVDTPRADFESVAAEMREIEEKYRLAARSLDRVENPRVLCAASEQYAEPSLGFHLDVAVLESNLGPECLTIDRALTSKRLRAYLTGGHFDIVHLVVAVDPKTGELLFGPVDGGAPAAEAKPDRMKASSFAGLLRESETRLVVLATCKALLLGVFVARVANMAASDQDISGEQAAEWADCFYGFLAQGRSVHDAFLLMESQFDTTIRSIFQKNVVFSIPKQPDPERAGPSPGELAGRPGLPR